MTDWTSEALWVLNDTDWGRETDITNGQIVSEWNTQQEKEFVREYLNDIISINGSTYWLTDHEHTLANRLDMFAEYYINGDKVEHEVFDREATDNYNASIPMKIQKKNRNYYMEYSDV